MGKPVPEEIVTQIVDQTNFPRLFRQYIDLEKQEDGYWGRCPFHDDEEGTFCLNTDKKLYYCYYCKEGGNVFTFLKKMEGWDFAQSLCHLANRANIDLTDYDIGAD